MRWTRNLTASVCSQESRVDMFWYFFKEAPLQLFLSHADNNPNLNISNIQIMVLVLIPISLLFNVKLIWIIFNKRLYEGKDCYCTKSWVRGLLWLNSFTVMLCIMALTICLQNNLEYLMISFGLFSYCQYQITILCRENNCQKTKRWSLILFLFKGNLLFFNF